MTIAQNLQAVRRQIAQLEAQYERQPNSVKLIAVSKGQPSSAIKAAFAAGQLAFGENYLQEALTKMQQLKDSAIEWHYIGIIQTNKTRAIAEHFMWVHSVSSVKVAQRLSAQRPEQLPPLNICIQVNVDSDPQKAGVRLGQLTALASEIATLPRIRLRGLMTIPAQDSLEHAQTVFTRLKQALLALQQQGFVLDTLSMGMSSDFAAAIAAGATQVRIGTAIFGPRLRKEQA